MAMNWSAGSASLRWRLGRLFESLGRTGWAGMAALVLAVVLAGTTLRNMNERLRQLENVVDGGGDKSREKARAIIAPTALARLMPGTMAATDLAALLPQLAEQQQVRIERSEYQLQRESGKPVATYRGDLVLSGSYLGLRAWMDAVLQARPSVAIDELVFERSDGNAREVALRVRLTLFMKGEL